MSKDQQRRRRAHTAAKRGTLLPWVITGLAALTGGAWIAVFMIWE